MTKYKLFILHKNACYNLDTFLIVCTQHWKLYHITFFFHFIFLMRNMTKKKKEETDKIKSVANDFQVLLSNNKIFYQSIGDWKLKNYKK